MKIIYFYQLISGLVMTVGDHKFHPECFQCQNCSNHIGDNETYLLLERTQLFCNVCFDQKVIPNAFPELHSIQLVKIKLPEDNRHPVKLKADSSKHPLVKSVKNDTNIRISE